MKMRINVLPIGGFRFAVEQKKWWGWHSQMWLTDKEGNMYHEDELVMI